MADSDSAATRLARGLEQLKATVADLERIAPIPELTADAVRRHSARAIVEDLLWRIHVLGQCVDEAERDVVLTSAVPAVGVRPELAEFRRYHRAWREKLGALAVSELEPTPSDGSGVSCEEPAADSVRDALVAAWEVFSYKFRGGDFDDGFEEDAVRAAEGLVRARWFRPESWSRNLRSLEPVLTSREPQQLPAHIRAGIREIYDSFLFGNGMAVVALTGSVLERAIVDRAAKFGLDPSAQRGDRAESKSLRRLADELAERCPELAISLDIIVTYRNDVMHPTRDNLTVLPSSAMRYARDCVTHIGKILERIYAP